MLQQALRMPLPLYKNDSSGILLSMTPSLIVWINLLFHTSVSTNVASPVLSTANNLHVISQKASSGIFSALTVSDLHAKVHTVFPIWTHYHHTAQHFILLVHSWTDASCLLLKWQIFQMPSYTMVHSFQNSTSKIWLLFFQKNSLFLPIHTSQMTLLSKHGPCPIRWSNVMLSCISLLSIPLWPLTLWMDSGTSHYLQPIQHASTLHLCLPLLLSILSLQNVTTWSSLYIAGKSSPLQIIALCSIVHNLCTIEF